MTVPTPTPIYRLIHVENLSTCLVREALYAPAQTQNDGLKYKTIHNLSIQQQRRVTSIPCKPYGTIHDYVSFYFGPRSPMLLQLKTGRVAGYTDGQNPLIYLVSDVQRISKAKQLFVFSDGHGIATISQWYNQLADLDKVDWNVVYARNWNDTTNAPDRQRRKQAEFLIYQRCGWDMINEIGVVNSEIKDKVVAAMEVFPANLQKPVNLRPKWYYE